MTRGGLIHYNLHNGTGVRSVTSRCVRCTTDWCLISISRKVVEPRVKGWSRSRRIVVKDECLSCKLSEVHNNIGSFCGSEPQTVDGDTSDGNAPVSYTHLRAHETDSY